MEGAGVPVMPAFGQGIGIANVAITICTGEHSATVLSVVGAGQMAGSRSPWASVVQMFCHARDVCVMFV